MKHDHLPRQARDKHDGKSRGKGVSGSAGNMLELGPGVPSVEELDDHVMDALREGCADAWSRGPISGEQTKKHRSFSSSLSG